MSPHYGKCKRVAKGWPGNHCDMRNEAHDVDLELIAEVCMHAMCALLK